MWSLLGIVTLLINLATNDASRISVGRRNKHTQGTFTASFRGYETADISTHATADTVKTALENLPSINLVDVESTSTGWSISFQSEAGDLPLIETTSGRLLNDNAKVIATEVVKGDAATLVYDGSETPGTRTFEALDLTSDSGYAFKVAPINAIGDGILSSASIVTVARAGASASKTTATGSALSRGVAGSIQEEQIVTFLSNDCNTDKLILSFELVSNVQTENLCDATEDEFEVALNELLGSNNAVHVSREDVSSSIGHSGYSWSVTFTSRLGDVPMLTVDKFQVGNGHDASGKQGLDGNYVLEFLKGQSNEFTIEPKKASGSVVRDIATYAGMEGGDAFFTELWTSDVSVVDGSHTWYSDGGVASYNTLLYIEQMIGIPKSIATPFHLSMDTSETLPWGRIDGMYSQTSDINDVSTVTLQDVLAELPNVGKVQVTQTNVNDASMNYFIVTFRDIFGEYPLLSASDPSIMISRNDGQFSATEVQTITLSVDKPFIYEVQSIAVSNDDAIFDLSFKDGPSTNLISCNFASIIEAQDAISSIEAELNALPNVKVLLDSSVGGSGLENDPWTYKVTFVEPIGPLPLLNSNKATITQLIQGESTLGGSIVLSYEGEYTDDIAFDASAKDVKDKLEMLGTIDEVNVRKIDKYTGYQWAVSFTGNAGNLPLMVAHDNIYEVQSIETSGGQPTPLGGTFTLSYLSEETGPLPFDSSADMIKSSLESLPSIDHVDVSQEMFEHGQAQWLVTFRLPSKPVQLTVNKSNMSGTLDDFTVSTLVSSVSPSLVAQSGSPPKIVVEEQVAGLPSYTGQYRAEAAGEYSLAVLQLDGGGLNAKYYDNQWMLEDPVIERVDPTINFHWGSDIITQYGRDYVSVCWWGKVRPQTSEPYTFYLHADDGARLYIDHELILDLWEEHSIEKKATVDLTADSFHDIKVEYKEITGDAHIQLEWSSRSLRKQVIPSSQLFHPSHIVGSPFTTTVSPGAADYPHSDFIDDLLLPGQNRSVAIAGDKTSFYLQAKDSSGNDKITNADAQGDLQEEQFEVDIVGDHGLVTGDVTYIEDGKYRVDYNVLKAGTYQVHVKTGGTDIYCGLGEDNKCSPFTLTVLPGATLASTCEVEASFDPVDDMVEAKAGEIGNLYLQAKDAFGNNRITGGDDVLVLFKSTANPDIQYRGNVVDRDDGSYSISYSIPLAGSYQVSITIGGEPVKLCVGPSGERWDSRQYNGISVYSSPSFCSLETEVNLNVIHRELHGITSTLVEDQNEGLSTAVVGVETGFTIEARDKFGNLRSGTSTSNIDESGDGESDAFLVSLVGPSGHPTLTSTAVHVLTSSDSSTSGYFRLSWGGQVSEDLPHDISGAAMQVLLSSMHDDDANDSTSVQVSRSSDNGNYQWKVTFVDHLDLWSQHPLSVLPGSDGFDSVSDTMSVIKLPSAGIYPVHYTLWEKGIHELSIISGTTLVSDSSYTVDVTNGLVDASSSSAFGLGLEGGIAGEESSFEVHVRDVRQSEVQSIKTYATSIEIINEVQQLQVLSNTGETFQLTFRGQQTGTIEVGLSTLDDITNELEALSSIGQVSLSSDGSFVIQNGDTIDVEFETEHGSLSLMTSGGPETITKLVDGETPHRAERQSLSCNADGGYIILSYKESTTTIDHDDDITTVTSKLSNLFGNTVSIVEPDDSILTICSSLEKTVFIDFPITLGDVEPPNISFNALENGAMSIFGNGEEHYGAVDGISPIMGYFTLSHNGDESSLISVTASEEEIKVALENLPSIGSVSVTRDVFGIRQDQDGQNIISGETSLFSIYTITFASEDGCEPGHWEKCPANIGDVSPLVVDTSLLTYDIGTTQQQSAPTIEVFEVVKGSSGNMLDDADDQVSIDVSLSHNIEEEVTIDSFDMDYLGEGIYNISYTPTASGHYSASIKVNNEYISTDLSGDVIISPAAASAQHCAHDINLVAVAGSEESIHVVARDRFGNLVDTLSSDTSLEVVLVGNSDDCQSVQRHEEPSTTIEELEMGSPEGHYKINYTPSLSGEYQSSIMLQSRGGLLATYYKNQDFSQPVYDETWCEVGEVCDSTRLDKDISFDCGFESPLPSDSSFPMESFSIVWEGEIKVDASDEYTFTAHLSGGARITIGDEIILDSLEDTSYFSVSSTPLSLDKDTFYLIKVEYVHKEEEAKMQLLWESSTITKEIVPSDVFYYTRHISKSPSSISVSPGDIATTSNASGEGLVSCTALEECSFIIQTQDENENNRYTDGSDPGFEITIQGSDGWALEGRVNSVAPSSPTPIELSDITTTSNDWQYIGEADVVHLSNHVTTKTNMVGTLYRGDSLVIEGTMYTVSATGTFDSSSLPLSTPYLGPTKSNVSVFKASSKCTSGTHSATYTPNVRGEYSIDVKLPSVFEVQRVTTSIHSEDSLGGAFSLIYQDEQGTELESGTIAFDADETSVQMAIEDIESIDSVSVSLHECDNPAISCSWDITFLSVEGDVNMLKPNTIQLVGDLSDIQMEEVVKGRSSKSITGFPRTIDVSPGETSPSWTTAYGRGLVLATAGEKASFVIQPKDAYGNDRLAEQDSDLFEVFIYPEQGKEDGSVPVMKGIVQRESEGYYTVEYTPTTSGHHTIAVVQAVSLEQQVITTGYDTVARGGSFIIKLGNLSTPPLPFDIDEATLKHALDTSMSTVSTFNVKKLDYGLFNFKYEITFETLMGDVPSFVVDTTNLIGNTNDWDVTTVADGMFQHIKLDDDNPIHEIQSIKIQVVDSSSLVGATFALSFNGQVTTPIAWDADADEVKQKLEALSTVGDIIVTLYVDDVTNERDYTITFDPYEGKSSNSLTNFGNLPLIGVSNVDENIITVISDTISNGASPFRVLVSPAEATSANTTAHDYQDEHGLSTGIYKTDTHFIIQSRDEYSNEIQDGPLREVQIIETSSTSNIGGFFEVSMYGNTTRLQANASPMQLEKALQSIPGIGSVSVSSNSAKDLVVGKTVAVTKGLDTIVPSEELVEFIVGDWIRIGDQGTKELFAITDMADVSPFTITLSSPYLGESDDALNVYQHGSSPSNRHGYQYIVSFDSILGDLPSLGVDGTLLEGNDATIEVTSCDWNMIQSLNAMGDGHFYLVYRDEETRLLSVDATAQELEDAILADITSIHEVSVSQQGSKSWNIHLKSFDGIVESFFAEGHLLEESGSISVSQVCPVSSDQTIYSATFVAGRRGEDYIVTLDDESTIVHGTVQHIEDGRYLATYEAPRVGTYSLSIRNAHGGGLSGEYFNNRWLYNEPASTRIDSQIDFHFGDDLVTTSGKDFVSVRWTGYIKPAFNEVYTFTAHVNDALKLWIGDELLIDEYENEVDEASGDEYDVFSASTHEPLKADQLVPIKIEYRENRGLAMIQLYWESISQPFAIIDQPRLFHSSTPIDGSPFEVLPTAIEPTEPMNCSVEIAAWDSLEVSWSAPNDNGGSNITKYLVESWDASDNESVPIESHEVVVEEDSNGSFHHLITGLSQPSSVLDGFGVRVSASNDQGYGNHCESMFLKPFGEPSPPKVVEVVRVANDPSSLALHWTSVSSPDDKSSVVTHYLVEVSSQDSFASIELSTMLSSDLVSSDRLSSYNNVDETWNYFLINEGLTPGKEHHLRISAVNEAGTGPSSRSTPLSLSPGGKPSDLDDVNLSTIEADDDTSVEESSSTLRLLWRSPTADNGFAVDKYLIETWLTDGINEVQELSLSSSSGELAKGTFTLGYGNDKTDSLSIDSTAEDVQSALESLGSIRSVRVWRSGVNPNFKWTITFMAGESDLLIVEDETTLTDDSGSVPAMQINTVTEAVAPIGYNTEIVTVEDPLQEHYELVLSDLTPGLSYSLRVSAANELGYSRPKTSIPLQLAPPIQKPSSPTNVILSVASSQSLEITFTKPDSDGGDTITLYRIEWDSDAEFGSDELSSYSFVSPKDGVGCVPCTHQINGLIKGKVYFVRVFAYNSHGYSVRPGLPAPPSEIPKTFPEPPEVVNISPQSDTSVRVQFPHSPDDGGAPVTRYLIEYNAQGYHSGHAMNDDHTALLYSPHTVQTITISADEDDISGVFRIAFEGHSTDEISATSSANDMELALKSLPTVGNVLVSRETTTTGHTWAVTFLSNHGNIDKYGPIELLTASIDPAALPNSFVTDISGGLGTNSRLVVHEEVTAYKGFERQTLTSQCNTAGGILSGTFAINFEGARTNDISFDVSPLDLKHELETIESIGTVQVTRRRVHDSINSFEMTIIFLNRLGNVPMLEVDDSLTCSDGSGSPLIYVVETTQGVLPNMNGPYSGEVELNALDYEEGSDIVHVVNGLQRNMPYHFQVSAWNGAGDTYGRSQYSIPPLMIPMDDPDDPRLVEMKPIDDSTLLINWDVSLTKGGSHMIKKFKVELNSTDSQYGDEEVFVVESSPEVQEILLESSASDMGGFIKVQFMGESSTNILVESSEDEIKQALEGISTIDQVSVSILPYTQDNMSSFGKKWIITIVSQTENLPSLLVDTGSGPPSTIATGGTLLGSSSVVRVETISDGGLPWSFITPSTLSSDKMYTCRVWAFNGHSWSEPASSRHAVSPSKSAPSEPRDVRVNVLSDTEIGVSWTEPLYSGGDDVASYRIEWDSDLMFDHSAITVSTHSGEDYYYVLDNLDPTDSYYVRVMAKSAKGFSEPSMASPLLSDTQTIYISLESNGSVAYTESFIIEYTTSDGFARSTNSLSIYATSQEVENELNSIGDTGAVSVDREDRSSSYDSSGIETDVFSILYRLTFVGVDDEVTLIVDDASLGSISATVETED